MDERKVRWQREKCGACWEVKSCQFLSGTRAAAVATDQKAYAPAPWRCASREAEIGRWNVALEQEKVVSAQEIPHERNALQEPETDASMVEEETLRVSRSGQEQARDVSAQEIQHEVAASDA